MDSIRKDKKINNHAFVDLGLPSGNLWATCNVGASSPEQAGLYFAWGETTGVTAEQVENGERKFNESLKEIKDNLALNQDAAHLNMGGSWRMPTKIDFHELLENTSHEIKNLNGTNVFLFTSNINGNTFFMPITSYWSSSIAGQRGAWLLTCHKGKYGDMVGVEFNFRSKLFSVRGVC